MTGSEILEDIAEEDRVQRENVDLPAIPGEAMRDRFARLNPEFIRDNNPSPALVSRIMTSGIYNFGGRK